MLVNIALMCCVGTVDYTPTTTNMYDEDQMRKHEKAQQASSDGYLACNQLITLWKFTVRGLTTPLSKGPCL